MARFLRAFVVAAVLFALISGYCLQFFIVIEPLVLIPTSLFLGVLVGGVLGAYASLLGPNRVGAWRFLGSALVMSIVAGIMGLLLGYVAVFETPFPRGKWTPMAVQPPERPIAFLGEGRVRSEGDPTVYVLTADGTVYSFPLVQFQGPGEWSEERSLDAPTARLGAGSFGSAVPPLLHKTISRQSFVIPGTDYAHYAYFAITEDGTIWQCLFVFYAISQMPMIVVMAFLFALSGFLSSFALLFERRTAAG